MVLRNFKADGNDTFPHPIINKPAKKGVVNAVNKVEQETGRLGMVAGTTLSTEAQKPVRKGRAQGTATVKAGHCKELALPRKQAGSSRVKTVDGGRILLTS